MLLNIVIVSFIFKIKLYFYFVLVYNCSKVRLFLLCFLGFFFLFCCFVPLI